MSGLYYPEAGHTILRKRVRRCLSSTAHWHTHARQTTCSSNCIKVCRSMHCPPTRRRQTHPQTTAQKTFELYLTLLCLHTVHRKNQSRKRLSSFSQSLFLSLSLIAAPLPSTSSSCPLGSLSPSFRLRLSTRRFPQLSLSL